jgi:hypothetical protein
MVQMQNRRIDSWTNTVRIQTISVIQWKDNNNWLIGRLYLHPVEVKIRHIME